MNCPKCKRPEIQFMLVGFMCRHDDCRHFFSTSETEAKAVSFLVERYTENNPENKPGLDGTVTYKPSEESHE